MNRALVFLTICAHANWYLVAEEDANRCQTPEAVPRNFSKFRVRSYARNALSLFAGHDSPRRFPTVVRLIPGRSPMLRLVLAATCLLFAHVSTQYAAELETGAVPRKAAPSRSDGTPQFTVYSCGNCSRTFAKIGDFPCIQSATKSAYAVTGSQKVWIVTGGQSNAYDLIHKQPDAKVRSYSVFAASPNQALRLRANVATLQETQAMVKRLREDHDQVVVVYNLK